MVFCNDETKMIRLGEFGFYFSLVYHISKIPIKNTLDLLISQMMESQRVSMLSLEGISSVKLFCDIKQYIASVKNFETSI